MKWTIDTENTGKLIRYYLQHVHGFSRKIIKSIVHNDGKILVNGEPKTVRYPLREGDELSVIFPKEQRGHYLTPEDLPLVVVYEDDDVLVIEKPPGVATVPSGIHRSGTIANAVLGHYERQGISYTFHVVTRLDRDTSGLLLIAKHRYSHSLLVRSQKARAISRSYQAVVEGHLENKNGTIDAPIGRKDGSIIERIVRDDGKYARTHYEVLKESEQHSLVDIRLETGRTHQIRVHFAHIGHPLAGDDLYGGSTDFISRQALHCHWLQFENPLSKETLEFSLPPADDMEALVKK